MTGIKITKFDENEPLEKMVLFAQLQEVWVLFSGGPREMKGLSRGNVNGYYGVLGQD